jgi:mRNA-degrading endonuclease toxin of MazEF toxin-antitoxin module
MVGADHGLKNDSAVNLDHVQTVEKARLKRYVSRLDPVMMDQVCTALAIATGCPEPG